VDIFLQLVMFGAMVTITVISLLTGAGVALPGPVLVLIGLLVAIPACMLLGFVIERVAYRPLRNAPKLAPLITAIGLSIVLQQAAILIWGRNYIPFPPILDHETIDVFGATITQLQVGIVVLCLALMVGLLVVVEKTKLGRAMRATSQNPAVAGLMGVNVNTIISATFVIGSALGAIAGVMVATNYDQAHYYMGFMIGLKAFTAWFPGLALSGHLCLHGADCGADFPSFWPAGREDGRSRLTRGTYDYECQQKTRRIHCLGHRAGSVAFRGG